MKNWQTTIGGLGMIIASIVFYALAIKKGPVDGQTYAIVAALVTGGAALIRAQDARQPGAGAAPEIPAASIDRAVKDQEAKK